MCYKRFKGINIYFLKIYFIGAAGISSLEKINEEELEDILNDCDPIGKNSRTLSKLKIQLCFLKIIFILKFLPEAPPGSYKIQPENQGKPQIANVPSINILKRKNNLVHWISRNGKVDDSADPCSEL